MIRILIVDDHLAMRIGLASMLGAQGELEIIGSAAGGEEALSMLEQQMPDILLLDLRMQRMDGISLKASRAPAYLSGRSYSPATTPMKMFIEL